MELHENRIMVESLRWPLTKVILTCFVYNGLFRSWSSGFPWKLTRKVNQVAGSTSFKNLDKMVYQAKKLMSKGLGRTNPYRLVLLSRVTPPSHPGDIDVASTSWSLIVRGPPTRWGPHTRHARVKHIRAALGRAGLSLQTQMGSSTRPDRATLLQNLNLIVIYQGERSLELSSWA